MFHSLRRSLRIWRASRRLGSKSWADFLTDRYPVSDFQSYADSGDLYFRLLCTRLPREHALILLEDYARAKGLVTNAGTRFDCVGEDLIASTSGMRLRIQTSEELLILHELFVEGRYNFVIQEPTVVIDIGANVGATALFLARNPLVNVIGFEAFAPNGCAARHNLQLNPHLAPRIKIHDLALGAADGVHAWEYSDRLRGSGGAFAMPQAATDTRPVEVCVANAATKVREIVDGAGSVRVVAKIDCEGSEFDIIECLVRNGLLGSIAAFVIEWHRRSGRDPQVLVKTFAENGFTLFTTGNETSETGMLYAARSTDGRAYHRPAGDGKAATRGV